MFVDDADELEAWQAFFDQGMQRCRSCRPASG